MVSEVSRQDIEISKERIKFSYLHYLSDSAAGFIVILTILVAYYTEATVPGIGKLHELLKVHPGVEAKVAFLVLALVGATPVGLVINAIGWFSIEWIKLSLGPCWFNWPTCPLVSPTNRNF